MASPFPGVAAMPVLNPAGHVGTVAALLINADGETLESAPRESVEIDWGGFVGEVHGGLTRLSCSRVTRQYPKGTEIRNTRQVSALGEEEIAAIAEELGLDALEPGWLGANLVVGGIPSFRSPATLLAAGLAGRRLAV